MSPAHGMLRALAIAVFAAAAGCSAPPVPPTPADAAPAIGQRLPRRGEEIVVAGQLFHAGTPVVLWTDPGGYDAYRVERRFGPADEAGWEATAKAPGGPASPNRYGQRRAGLTDAEIERLRGGGWDLPTLARVVDQIVVHYDAAGTSRRCFRVLHDRRGLSAHFLIDLDGTVYQTLDVKERAWHATKANDRSVGIEIAGVGAFADPAAPLLSQWYSRDADGLRITVPGETGFRVRDFVPRPARGEMIAGEIHGRRLHQYDFTPQQYEALARLTAALCRVLPQIRPDAPRDAAGRVITRRLTDAEFAAHRGLLGHYHVQADKVNPGPAFDWERLLAALR